MSNLMRGSKPQSFQNIDFVTWVVCIFTTTIERVNTFFWKSELELWVVMVLLLMMVNYSFFLAQDEPVPLIVELVDLRVAANTKFHYTDCFSLACQHNSRLIVRRGSPVKINLTLNRKFESEKDVLCLVFTLKGMPVMFCVYTGDSHGWYLDPQ